MEKLENREDAGKKLASELSHLRLQNPVVIALPRGGVPVAYEIAKTLNCSLEVMMIKKLGAPINPEVAIGAVGEDGTTVLNHHLIETLGIDKRTIDELAKKKAREIQEQIRKFRSQQTMPIHTGKDVIIVDDGLATGATMVAALRLLQKQKPRKIILALPVAPPDALEKLRDEVDEVICLMTPARFTAVGVWYDDFTQVSDEEVIRLLKKAEQKGKTQDKEISILHRNTTVPGDLALVNNSKGIIIFAHGSGSSRKSPRNQYVATELNKAGFSTLLFDLLTDEEASNRANVFNIPLLAERLNAAADTIAKTTETKNQPIGFFGASTGGGAAILAAAQSSQDIFAIVSRGGRPDLAGDALSQVSTPCLLIVGGDDEPTLSLNKKALRQLKTAQLVIVPGATHLFEEEGALSEVVEHASSWFLSRANKEPALRLEEKVLSELKAKAVPFRGVSSLDELINNISQSKIVMLGESSHGTHEFYTLRRIISERLLKNHGFKFLAVEGDWPEFQSINKYISGESPGTASEALKIFSRWPTWMWANEEAIELVENLKELNVPVYGLDVYSLFKSIAEVKKYARSKDMDLSLTVESAYACFDPFQKNEKSYAKHLTQFPEGCRHEVIATLRKLLRLRLSQDSESRQRLFDAQQNARIVANAEDYYRQMLFGGAESWNVRDRHMLDTLDVLMKQAGPDAKCIVWAHNSHIGDYHATDMLGQGYINLGGLARELYGMDAVSLVGFGTAKGKVLAAHAWDGKEMAMSLPDAHPTSFEGFCHKAVHDLKTSGFSIVFDEQSREGHLGKRSYGHRAVGVVYDPQHEGARLNYVPTVIAQRYDAFVFIDETTETHPIKTKANELDMPETWPGGV